MRTPTRLECFLCERPGPQYPSLTAARRDAVRIGWSRDGATGRFRCPHCHGRHVRSHEPLEFVVLELPAGLHAALVAEAAKRDMELTEWFCELADVEWHDDWPAEAIAS